MNIAFFIPSYFPNTGGAEVLLHNYLINLNKKKKKIILVLTLESWLRLKIKNIKLPYKVVVIYIPFLFRIEKYFSYLSVLIMRFFIKKISSKYQIDFWHCIMMYPSGYLLSRAIANLNIPLVIRAIGIDIQKMEEINYGYRLDKKIDQKVKNYTKADYFISSCPDVTNEYKKLNIKNSNIIEIPNAVNKSLFLDNNLGKLFKKKFKINNNKKIFLTVSRNHSKKGLTYLLKAISVLKKNNYHHNSLFIIFGNGVKKLKYETQLLNITQECLLIEENNNSINYNDYLPGKLLRSAYVAADYFILPSIIETFGIVLVEAMASSCPIIATKTDGCNSVLENGKYGYQIEKGQPKEIYNAILYFLNNEKEVKKYIELGRERLKKYDLENAINQLLSLPLQSKSKSK